MDLVRKVQIFRSQPKVFMADGPTCHWQMSGNGLGVWKSSTRIRTYIRAKMVFERSVWVKLHEYADCNGTQYVALGQVGNQTDY